MRRPHRTALVFALVMVLPFLAGCNLVTWSKQEGFVSVDLVVVGPKDTALGDFRTVQIAIYGVSIKQFLILESHEFKFNQPPLIDLVKQGTKGEHVPLVSRTNMSIRAIESITLHLDVIKAEDASGNDVPICHQGDEVTSFPCFFVPDNQAYRHQDRNIALKRGGTLTVGFPLAVLMFNQNSVGNDPEYALVEDPALVQITTKS